MESRVRENFMHGLMRGHQRQGDGRLERDTRLKREKRYLLTSPGHYCAGVLLYNVSCCFGYAGVGERVQPRQTVL